MSRERFSILRIIGLGDLKGQPASIHFTFWIMLLSAFFLFADQNLPASNLSRIAAAFGLTDEKEYRFMLGGLVNLPFFVLGGVVSVLYGRLTDRIDRKKLLVTAVVLGELPCLLTGFAQDYWTYFVLRMFTGFGIGGVFPILFSITGDLFRTENRPTASAWVGLAMSLGMGLGQLFAGSVAHDVIFGLEGWRFSFIAVALPAFPIALLFYFFARIPQHGAADSAALGLGSSADSAALTEEAPVTAESFKRVFSTRTNILAFLQGIPGTVPWGFLFVYAVDFFEKSKGWSVDTGNTVVLMFAGMSILGGFLGGFIGKKLYAMNRRLFPAFCAFTVIVGAIPTFYLINYNGASMMPAFIAALIGGLIVPMTGANVRAILINTNLPENRGAVFGVFNLTDDLGKGVGPFFIGLFLLAMPALLAYNVAISMWIVCGIVWLGMIFTMNADEDRVTEELKKRGKT
ncbi:MAG: MFS transporter [Leptospiraceae bacterium]|nr:MFS transporter [Leptospiraceae bacterium]